MARCLISFLRKILRRVVLERSGRSCDSTVVVSVSQSAFAVVRVASHRRHRASVRAQVPIFHVDVGNRKTRTFQAAMKCFLSMCWSTYLSSSCSSRKDEPRSVASKRAHSPELASEEPWVDVGVARVCFVQLALVALCEHLSCKILILAQRHVDEDSGPLAC